MDDNYVYLSVKVYLQPGADPHDVIAECDYSFSHEEIVDTEIMEVLDTKED